MVAQKFEGREPASTSIEGCKSFPNDGTTMHLRSITYDEARCDGNMPLLAVSPCLSEDSSSLARSVTGKYISVEDKYIVDSRILGTGHQGSVRTCTDRNTGNKYAVKSIRKSDPVVDLFALPREIALLEKMRHRNVVRLVDLYEDAEYLHLVTDLCSGGELFDRIEQRWNEDNDMPCFTEDEAARTVKQILEAVSYMHSRDVVHRDIKPENILFQSADERSPVKLVDFGLACKHISGIDPPMRKIVGTPYYTAPEVLRKEYDRSCDLWSVGVVAYVLLCGYPPFRGADNKQVYVAVRRGYYRFRSRDWSKTSRESRDFIRKLLQKDPRKRMTAEEALEHPWIAIYAGEGGREAPVAAEDRDEDGSIEVVFGGREEDDSILYDASPR